MTSPNLPLYVFIGTKAQYIKTAPLLHRFESANISYFLIDSGQHGAFSPDLRHQLGIKEPDIVFATEGNISTVFEAAIWFSKYLLKGLLNRRWLQRSVFPLGRGICVVHGDTPSTLLAVLLARLYGVKVAHIEAGLRSYRWLKPFPEEIIRIICMHLSHILFASSDWAAENLRNMGIKGRVINTRQNSGIESLYYALELATPGPTPEPYAIMTIHRVETLLSRKSLRLLVKWAEHISESIPVRFILHDPTRKRLEQNGLMPRLTTNPQISVEPLLPYPQFIQSLNQAQFVLTDGGSVQEECYYLGVPCLVLRSETERKEGIGENARLSNFDDRDLEIFLNEFASLRRTKLVRNNEPSVCVFNELMRCIMGNLAPTNAP